MAFFLLDTGPPVPATAPAAPKNAETAGSRLPRGRRPRTADLRALVLRLQGARVPIATYRVQFNADAGFSYRQAAALAPYLHALGASDLYASPYFKARSGSTHGYDVADPSALDPRLGGEADYAAMVSALSHHGLGQLVDVVPNHMGIGDPGNYRWLDVLENGPASIYARFFDINWHPLKAAPGSDDENKVILPILGDQYGAVLEADDLSVQYREDDGSFTCRYFEHSFPLAPDTYVDVLAPVLTEMEDTLGRRHEDAQELASILTALRNLPPRVTALTRAQREERDREKRIVQRRMLALRHRSALFQDALMRAITDLAGRAGDPASFDRLDQLLERQSYRLAYWRVASEEINYRRFFDVTELAAVRMEDPAVFRETHALLLRLVADGVLNGLRIDHPDGLLDPAGYLWQLQRAAFVERHRAAVAAELGLSATEAGETLGGLFDAERRRRPSSPLLRSGAYVVVEKILGPGEALPPTWPVHGTTGYDFMTLLNGLLVARENRRQFDALYARFIGDQQPFAEIVNSRKKMVMLISLASEVNELAYALKSLAAGDRRHRDFTLNLLTFAVREVIAALPVYRTYLDPTTGEASATDRGYVETAVAEAKRRNPRTDPSLFDFIRDTLLLEGRPSRENGGALPADDPRLRFVATFQQATGPVMAKGVEDTAFYVYNRLVSLNEVGGEPDQFGFSIAQFHRACAERARTAPYALLSTSTHDTKRSEDVRARIAVLSEVPRQWRAALGRWGRLNAGHTQRVGSRRAPDRNEEYLLYQVLLGTWPFEPFPDAAARTEYTGRIQAFMLKAGREAKVNTSWVNPNEAFEQAVAHFVERVLDPVASARFLEDFAGLARVVAHGGIANSLAQTLLKAAAPGVPDFYQGTELWDFSLVDPDNRRPVDFAHREKLLHALRAAARKDGALELVRTLAAEPADGRIKLWLTHRALAVRQEHPAAVVGGSYQPLRVEGPHADHVCAFARTGGGATLIAVAALRTTTLLGTRLEPALGEAVWGPTCLRLPPGTVQVENALTGESLGAEQRDGRLGLSLGAVLSALPVALLVGRAHREALALSIPG